MSAYPNAPEDVLQHPATPISLQASRVLTTTILIGALALFVWAGTTKLDRVTRGGGRIVSEERNSLVQHFEGGIITQVLVKEGDTVAQGATLMRIENSFAEAELAASQLSLQTNELMRVRLVAEAEGSETLDFSAFEHVVPDDVLDQQRQLFARRQAERSETLTVLDEQVAQKELELSEKQSRLSSRRREGALMAERLKSLRQLSADGAVARNELLENETRYEQLLAQISDLEHQVPQTEAALNEMRGRRREASLSFQAEAQRELTEVNFEISRLEESISAFEDRRLRFDVSAPRDGIVNKLFISTVGGVVRPGQTLVELVPEDAPVAVEARILPRDRAKVRPGQTALVKISAYDFTRFGGIEGTVTEISADALQDDDGSIYFRVRIEASADQFGQDNPIVPGMLADVDIISGQQSILDYLMKPIRTVQSKALRE